MSDSDSNVTRRRFLQTTIAAAGASALPFDRLAAAALPFGGMGAAAKTAAKYTRYSVTSLEGQRALVSYARGVQAMLNLPATDPRNWFRNAFIHLMDCPHGNWWFYVWHRGYLGYLEQTIRTLSEDPNFAMPFWDWTELPQIPNAMFNGVLTPSDVAYAPYTGNLAVFTSFIQPALQDYWSKLSAAQLAQLSLRGYTTFDLMWNDVTGNNVSGNVAYANPCAARYLTRDNPKLNGPTGFDVSPFVVRAGLMVRAFNVPQVGLSFTSLKTKSHNAQPAKFSFSILEGFPHNKVHNYIGGVGPLDPGPYGSMTNFLSPVDPIFFLHHSNMDRLWDVWARKQIGLGLPFLPTGADLADLSNEPFLFYANDTGGYVGPSNAGKYLSTEAFDYNYGPGFGEAFVHPPKALLAGRAMSPVTGTVKGNTATLALPADAVKNHLDPDLASSLVVEITVSRPSAASPGREFDVFIGEQQDATQTGVDNPNYAGTAAFFGNMSHMDGMAAEATFAVPLPKSSAVFRNLQALNSTRLTIRIVPSPDRGQKGGLLKSAPKAPVLKSVVVRTQ